MVENDDAVKSLFKSVFGKRALIFPHKGRTLKQQLDLLGNACFIASVHGGGMYKSFFAPDGAHVLEIQHHSWGYGVFWLMNSAAMHHYHYVKMDETGRIDIEKLSDILQIIKKKLT